MNSQILGKEARHKESPNNSILVSVLQTLGDQQPTRFECQQYELSMSLELNQLGWFAFYNDSPNSSSLGIVRV